MSDDEIKTTGGVFAKVETLVEGPWLDMQRTDSMNQAMFVAKWLEPGVEAAMQHLDAEVGPRKPGQDVVVRIWVGWVDE